MYDISVIIVSWNTQAFVRQCLRSLRDSCSDVRMEILVVDNGSSDGTPEMVSREFPEAKLLLNGENLGFARANNRALRIAAGRYIALVNSDVTVPPGCVQALMQYLDDHDAAGMVGPLMLTPAGSPSPSCMREPTLTIWLAHALGVASIFTRTALHMRNTGSPVPQEVDVLNGWFWVVRRSAMDRVGLLDERFFMYGEDIEWCGRFRAGGWKVVFYPKASAVHYGGASSSREPVRYYLEMQRARLQYWRLRHRALSQAAYVVVLGLHQAFRVAGYGLLYVLGLRRSGEVRFKIKRSAACLAWLILGVRPAGAALR